jgi:hypothetical protein
MNSEFARFDPTICGSSMESAHANAPTQEEGYELPNSPPLLPPIPPIRDLHLVKPDFDREGRSKPIQPRAYDGKNMNLSIWLDEYETIARANNWNDDDKFNQLISCLSGNARIWYLDQTSIGFLNNWDQAREGLKRYFGDTNRMLTRSKLSKRVQERNEPVMDYVCDILSLCRVVDKTMTEEERADHIITGLKPSLQFSVLKKFNQRAPKSAAEVIQVIRGMEDAYAIAYSNRDKYRQWQPNRVDNRRINVIQTDNKNSKVNRPKSNNKPWSPCFHCQKDGKIEYHWHAECPKIKNKETQDKTRQSRRRANPKFWETIRCFNCNEIGHLKVHCPKLDKITEEKLNSSGQEN